MYCKLCSNVIAYNADKFIDLFVYKEVMQLRIMLNKYVGFFRL